MAHAYILTVINKMKLLVNSVLMDGLKIKEETVLTMIV